MSTSIDSVKCGIVAFDSAMRRAMICWIREGSSTVTSPLPVSPAGALSASGAFSSAAGCSAPSGPAGSASRAFGSSPSAPSFSAFAPAPDAAASTSALTIRPPGPVPSIFERSMSCSRAMRRATGAPFARPPLPSAAGARSASAVASPPPSRSPSDSARGWASSASSACSSSSASGSSSCSSASGSSSGSSPSPSSSASSSEVFVAVPPPSEESSSPSALASFSDSSCPPPSDDPPPPSPMRAMTSPTASVAPSSATISSVPSASASYVIVALSVSISTSSSPFETSSPSALSHLRIVPSSMESDRRGIVMSGIARDATKRQTTAAPASRGSCRRSCKRVRRSGGDELALGAQPVLHRVRARTEEVQLVRAQGDLVVRHGLGRGGPLTGARLDGAAHALGRGGLRGGGVLRHGSCPFVRSSVLTPGTRRTRTSPRVRAARPKSCARGYVPQRMAAADLDPGRALADLRALRELTGDDRGAQRVAWTDTWAEGRAWLRERLGELPLDVDADEAGNLWAVLPGASAETVVLGSHVDSVPAGGWLDGALGVLAGLEVLRALAAAGEPPVTVALVDWADEEGARFGHSLLGSSAAAGLLDAGAARALRDRDGVALSDALAEHGVELERMPIAAEERPALAAYLE